jgi:hypothetical protein
MLNQGSFAANGVPFCNSSIEIPSGLLMKAIFPSRGGLWVRHIGMHRCVRENVCVERERVGWVWREPVLCVCVWRSATNVEAAAWGAVTGSTTNASACTRSIILSVPCLNPILAVPCLQPNSVQSQTHATIRRACVEGHVPQDRDPFFLQRSAQCVNIIAAVGEMAKVSAWLFKLLPTPVISQLPSACNAIMAGKGWYWSP